MLFFINQHRKLTYNVICRIFSQVAVSCFGASADCRVWESAATAGAELNCKGSLKVTWGQTSV